MVRLLPKRSSAFQSHKAIAKQNVSIPQWCDCLLRLKDANFVFQSHNGAIADRVERNVSIPQWCDCSTKFSFNPTMVRLLRSRPTTMSTCPLFQSHNGAIAAQSTYANYPTMNSSFNPTMVRLLLRGCPSFLPHPCFNPTMVRLLHEERPS
jgi:ribosomal protein L39E